MDTLCVIYNKMIISRFYGLLFLIFNAFLFSFVKLKFYTHHNSCLPPDLAKIKASSKNTTKLRLLSKKSKIVKQFTFSSHIFITCWLDILIWLDFQVKNQHRNLLWRVIHKSTYAAKPLFFWPPSPCTHLFAFTFRYPLRTFVRSGRNSVRLSCF